MTLIVLLLLEFRPQSHGDAEILWGMMKTLVRVFPKNSVTLWLSGKFPVRKAKPKFIIRAICLFVSFALKMFHQKVDPPQFGVHHVFGLEEGVTFALV